jgi:hypothetical protein
MRRCAAGEIGGRQFESVPLMAVDAVLTDRGINDWNKLMAASPEQLRRWLDATAVFYEEILNYEGYWAGLISIRRLNARDKIVSTRTGHQIFTAQSHRYSVDLAPAIDPIDIAINSVLSLIDLRDLRLARAKYEVDREMLMPFRLRASISRNCKRPLSSRNGVSTTRCWRPTAPGTSDD